MTAHDDRARDEQPAPTAKLHFVPMPGHPSDAPGLVARCGLPIGHTGRCVPLVEQPTPTAREIPADDRRLSLQESMDLIRERYSEAIAALGEERELAEAAPPEVWWGPGVGLIEHVGNVGDEAVYRYLNAGEPFEAHTVPTDAIALVPAPSVGWCEQLAELGRELDAARAEVDDLRQGYERMKAFNRQQHREALAYEAEVERLREENAELRDGLILIECDDPDHAELAELRARDEKGAAVAQHWDGTIYDTTNDNPLWGELDELKRAHEARDGGRDR